MTQLESRLFVRQCGLPTCELTVTRGCTSPIDLWIFISCLLISISPMHMLVRSGNKTHTVPSLFATSGKSFPQVGLKKQSTDCKTLRELVIHHLSMYAKRTAFWDSDCGGISPPELPYYDCSECNWYHRSGRRCTGLPQ